jgi:hypothetical protein
MSSDNDIVNKAMGFIFEADKKALREATISLLALHLQPLAGGPIHDIMNVGVRYRDTTWAHPNRPKQVRGMVALNVVNVLPEHETRAANLYSDYTTLQRDSGRAVKTLTQLVRGMHTDQDIRDSLPDCLANKLGLGHLTRIREPAFRYTTMEPRVHASILKDLEMIQGYFDARLFMS